jgi:hypothetical protein
MIFTSFDGNISSIIEIKTEIKTYKNILISVYYNLLKLNGIMKREMRS